MAIVALVLLILLILIAIVAIFLAFKLNSEYNAKAQETILDIFKERYFEVDSLLVISKKLTIALNKKFNKIALVENYNPATPDIYTYQEIKTSSILNITNDKFNTNISYRTETGTKSISVAYFSKEAKDFCHGLLSKINFRKLALIYPDFKFDIFTSSNWECEYIWAYDSLRCAFAYISTKDKKMHQLLNLRKELTAISLEYNYLELPMMGEMRQLSVFDKSFLENMFSSLYEKIKNHITFVYEDKIFYDSYAEILYLSDGISNFQTLILEKIDDVFYRENRLQFTMLNNKHIINFAADKEFINEFEKFVMNYNLRKIATNFDYKYDKLINVNTNTKFVIDYSRDRLVYCANLNKFHSFSYMTIAFSELEDSEVIQNTAKCYVRIKTKDNEILDVTCLKNDVAYYIKAQIDSIVSKSEL